MDNKAKLYQKILQVMDDIKYLKKDDQIKFGNTNYKAISEEKVTSAVRESLIKNKLIILPVEQEHLKVDSLTTVNTKYKICDTETGEYEILASSGTGVDTQDKGVGKAMTYAYKYLLLRTFAIPTGEDPDKISSEELDKTFETQKIDKIKVKTIKDLISLKNVEELTVLNYYKVDKFEDMTIQVWTEAMNYLKRK